MKEFPYTMTYSQAKTGSTTVMRAVASAGIPIHRCYVGNVKEYHQRDMPTITMVREPVARYLSELWEKYMAGGEYPPSISRETMMAEIEESLDWFDDHYRDLVGINVYGTTFVKKAGYLIYAIRGLVVVTERMSEVLETALKEFLPPYFPDADYDSLTVDHRAIGTERFGKGYDKFLKEAKFPRKYLEKIYDHQFCNNFFYKKDVAEAYRRWRE